MFRWLQVAAGTGIGGQRSGEVGGDRSSGGTAAVSSKQNWSCWKIEHEKRGIRSSGSVLDCLGRYPSRLRATAARTHQGMSKEVAGGRRRELEAAESANHSSNRTGPKIGEPGLSFDFSNPPASCGCDGRSMMVEEVLRSGMVVVVVGVGSGHGATTTHKQQLHLPGRK